MRGLVPRIHIGPVRRRDVEGRNKCGHDEVGNRPRGHGVMAKRTMRAPDERRLTPADDMPPETIRALRPRETASQAVFAHHLNVTTSPVSQWERAEKRPRTAPLKPLTLVAKHGLSAVA